MNKGLSAVAALAVTLPSVAMANGVPQAVSNQRDAAASTGSIALPSSVMDMMSRIASGALCADADYLAGIIEGPTAQAVASQKK